MFMRERRTHEYRTHLRRGNTSHPKRAQTATVRAVLGWRESIMTTDTLRREGTLTPGAEFEIYLKVSAWDDELPVPVPLLRDAIGAVELELSSGFVGDEVSDMLRSASEDDSVDDVNDVDEETEETGSSALLELSGVWTDDVDDIADDVDDVDDVDDEIMVPYSFELRVSLTTPELSGLEADLNEILQQAAADLVGSVHAALQGALGDEDDATDGDDVDDTDNEAEPALS